MTDSMYEINKRECPNLDDFPNTNNSFLQSIWEQAHNRRLSERQVFSANKAYDKIINPPKMIKLSAEDRRSLLYIISNYTPQSNYYHQQEFLDSISAQIEGSGVITDKQYAALMRKLEHYKKSILNKIWGYVKPPSKRKKK